MVIKKWLMSKYQSTDKLLFNSLFTIVLIVIQKNILYLNYSYFWLQ